MRPPAYNRGMSDPVSQRPTRIRVDLDALSHNLRAIRAHVRVPVMAIIKANAYGHGLLPVALHLQSQGVEQLGVAFVEEGIALRRAGVTVPILVLGGIFGRQVAQFIAHDLEVTVSSLDKLRQVEAAAETMGRKAVVHLKIDTGMGRLGVLPERALLGDRSAIAALELEVVRPLADAGPALSETLDAYLDAGGAIEACARKLFVHPNTVRYRLRRIADFTGRDPMVPRDAYVLRVASTVGRLTRQAPHSNPQIA